jgi:hypothetical protein
VAPAVLEFELDAVVELVEGVAFVEDAGLAEDIALVESAELVQDADLVEWAGHAVDAELVESLERKTSACSFRHCFCLQHLWILY